MGGIPMGDLLDLCEQTESASFNDQLEAFFLEHIGELIDGMVLMKVAGGYAWRSRVSDVRRRMAPRGFTIENIQTRRPDKSVKSCYRLVEKK
jgi:hypothetical protein